ncbi:MAG: hypothetical protein QG585_388 [Patescibacteria group bacterium]|jgi:hypothetical protein|nr:hypothetical protein [Patescibacteria group bacterium]
MLKFNAGGTTMTEEDLRNDPKAIQRLYPAGTVFDSRGQPVMTPREEQDFLDFGNGHEDESDEAKTPDLSGADDRYVVHSTPRIRGGVTAIGDED